MKKILFLIALTALARKFKNAGKHNVTAATQARAS